MKTPLKRWLWSVALLAPLACLPDQTHGGFNPHSCTLLSANDYWTAANLSLYHSDARACPAFGGWGEVVGSGGTIVQNAPVPDPTDDDYAMEATLNVHNTNDSCTENPFGAPISTEEEEFAWADYLYLGSDQWGVQIYTAYESGTGGDPLSDCPVFKVETYGPYDPIAKTWVRYSEYW